MEEEVVVMAAVELRVVATVEATGARLEEEAAPTLGMGQIGQIGQMSGDLQTSGPQGKPGLCPEKPTRDHP